jgi:hypothetical protein
MRFFLKWSFRLLLLLLLLLAAVIAHTIWFKPMKIDWFFERVFIEYAVGQSRDALGHAYAAAVDGLVQR